VIVKLDLNAKQLVALHQCLQSPENYWGEHIATKPNQKRSFVWIKSVKGCGKNDKPVPFYEVVLEVEMTYRMQHCTDNWVQTPLEKLTRVLHAIELFPEEADKPDPLHLH
jgi:hypothetical protein